MYFKLTEKSVTSGLEFSRLDTILMVLHVWPILCYYSIQVEYIKYTEFKQHFTKKKILWIMEWQQFKFLTPGKKKTNYNACFALRMINTNKGIYGKQQRCIKETAKVYWGNIKDI